MPRKPLILVLLCVLSPLVMLAGIFLHRPPTLDEDLNAIKSLSDLNACAEFITQSKAIYARWLDSGRPADLVIITVKLNSASQERYAYSRDDSLDDLSDYFAIHCLDRIQSTPDLDYLAVYFVLANVHSAGPHTPNRSDPLSCSATARAEAILKIWLHFNAEIDPSFDPTSPGAGTRWYRQYKLHRCNAEFTGRVIGLLHAIYRNNPTDQPALRTLLYRDLPDPLLQSRITGP